MPEPIATSAVPTSTPTITEKPAAKSFEVVADTPQAESFEKASQALKTQTSWEKQPTDQVTTQPAPEVTDAATAGEDPAETATVDPYEGWTVDAQGSLHRKDGTFAEISEIEAYNAHVEAENAKVAAPTEDPKTEQPASEAQVVKLRARDGSEVEIEVTDEKVAETLRTNQRDGLRGEEYRRKLQAVEEGLAEKRAFETAIETNPEGLILQHLPEDKQISLAVALVAKHWDSIAPALVKFDSEPATRIAETANTQTRIASQQREFEQLTARQKYGAQLESAARALIPEHADDAVAEQFMYDAAQDLGRAVQRNGRPIDIQDVAKVLSPRLALYGFDKPAPAKVDEPPKRPVARAVAKPTPKAPTATATVTNGQTVRAKVSAQKVAAAVPQPGAGAATVRAPLVPVGSSIEQASQALKKQKSWAS